VSHITEHVVAAGAYTVALPYGGPLTYGKCVIMTSRTETIGNCRMQGIMPILKV